MKSNWKGYLISKIFFIGLAIFFGLIIPISLIAGPDNCFLKVSEEVVTLHIKWAKPYHQGPIKLLVIAPAWGQRETVELMQRFDFDCEVLMTHTFRILASRAYGSVQYLLPSQVTNRFDKMLKKEFDVIIIGGFDWSKLLIDHRYKILKKLYDGTGFIYVSPPNNKELNKIFSKGILKKEGKIVNGIPWENLTAFKGKKPENIVKTGSFGNGRWVILNYRTNSTNQSLTPRMQPWPADWEYEYYQSLLGKAILWAGKKESKVIINAREIKEIDRASLPYKFRITISTLNSQKNLYLQTSFHSLADNKVIASTENKVKLIQEENSLDLSLPLLPEGRYICNLFLKDSNQRIISWFSFPLSISSVLKISQVVLNKDSYNANEPISGKVVLTRPLKRDEKLYIQLWDNHNRLLRNEEKFQGKEFSFLYRQIEPLDTNIHQIEATLIDKRGKVASKRVEFSIRGRKRPDFHLAIWEESETDYISSLWYKQFRKLGVDGIFYTIARGHIKSASRLIAQANLFSCPMFPAYRTRIKKTKIGPVHTNCLHDPSFLEKQKEKTLQIAGNWGKYDVLFYGDGSDKSLAGNCFSPYCLQTFRAWLKERYGTLKKLNQIWKTSFSSWEEVIPDTLEKAKEKNNFASWVEHTRFMETSYAQYYQLISDTLKTIDKDALMGPSGYGRLNSNSGADWWKLLQTVSFYNLYTYQDAPQLEITRSLAENFPNVKLRSIYYGSYIKQFGNYKFMRLIPWYALFHNYNGLYWYMGNGKTTWPCDSGSLAGPDFRARRSFLVSKKEIDEIKKGPAQLIFRAKRSDDKIAIFYDQTAVHAATAYSHPSYLVQSYGTFQLILEDLGLQYNYLVSSQIEDGILRRKNYKVLILPYILSLSDKAAAEIKKFVKDGGLLIANTIPAKYDYYLQPAKNGSLLSEILGNPGDLKKVGSGKTIILKDIPFNYWSKRWKSEGKKVRQLFVPLFKEINLTRFVTLRNKDNSDADTPGLEVITYSQGKNYYLGFMNNSPSKLSTTIVIPKTYYVYDVRKKIYLGEKKKWELNIDEGESKLFALLPYQVKDLKIKSLDFPVKSKVYKFSVEIKTLPSNEFPSLHTFLIEVFDPDGNIKPEYTQVITSNGKIPFALNDPSGIWKLRATETVSGKSTEIKISL